MKSIAFVCLLLVPFCLASETSFFKDRSADVVVTPQNIQDDSFVYVSERFTTTSNDIEETSVADLISNALGGPVISKVAQSSHSNPASANLLVIVDSVGQDHIAHFEKTTPMRALQGGKRLKLTRVAYPQDNVASVATLVTGNTPSVHGVVNKQWQNEFGAIVSAYKAQALPISASVFDVMSQVTDGRSLVVSASADYQLASAVGVHQMLHAENPSGSKLGFYFDDDVQQFAGLFHGVTSNVRLTVGDVLTRLTAAKFDLPAVTDKLTFDASTSSVVADFASHGCVCTFDLLKKVDFTFFAEIELFRAVVEEIKNMPASQDNSADMISFVFSSLRAIQTKYGQTSQQHKAALVIIDSVLVELVAEVKNIYGDNKVATEIVFLGQSAYTTLQQNKIAQEAVYRYVKNYVPTRSTFNKFFPAVYAPVCDTVQQVVDRFPQWELQTECSSHLQSRNMLESNGTVFNPYPDYASFNIVLWSSIGLGLALAGTIYALCAMDIGADSFLYRTPNPKFHAQ
jgi:hypothetical protein